MKRSKKIKSVSLLLAAAVLMVLGIAAIAMAASVTPNEIEGNTPGTPAGCLKVEPPDGGTFSIPNYPGMEITVTISGDGKYLSFDSDIRVTKVWVKGGPNYNEYNYGSPGVFSDSGLVSPHNPGENVPTISHYTICFGTPDETTSTTTQEETSTTSTTTQEETSTTSTTTQEETSTTQGEQTTVTKIDTGAGGSTGLGTGTWALGFLALALAGGLGWTALRPALRKNK